MNTEHIHSAVQFLVKRRSTDNRDRLPKDLIPSSSDEAFAIQLATSEIIGDRVAGWKTGLPSEDNLILAPLFSTMINKGSVCFARPENGVCRIEPEIAFQIGENIPPRQEKYSNDEIKNSISKAYLAIELIENRYNGYEEIPHNEHLADCLFNQGIYLGPEISVENAIATNEVELLLTQGKEVSIKGSHPNQSTIKPLYWLADYLSKNGSGLKAGDIVITGSLAGVIEVLPDQELNLDYVGLGKFSFTITNRTEYHPKHN